MSQSINSPLSYNWISWMVKFHFREMKIQNTQIS